MVVDPAGGGCRGGGGERGVGFLHAANMASGAGAAGGDTNDGRRKGGANDGAGANGANGGRGGCGPAAGSRRGGCTGFGLMTCGSLWRRRSRASRAAQLTKVYTVGGFGACHPGVPGSLTQKMFLAIAWRISPRWLRFNQHGMRVGKLRCGLPDCLLTLPIRLLCILHSLLIYAPQLLGMSAAHFA